jgi:5-methylcytosine-specific restriction endonuclease McrA
MSIMIDAPDEETTESRSHTKIPRAEQVAALVERDGMSCQFPSCGNTLDLTVLDGPHEVTLDHWIPQWFGKENNWSYDEIWDLSNLKLMHKKCNAKKGDRIPNEDGTLPDRPQTKFRYRRDKRAERPELCLACDNGHNLLVGEVCASCNCDAQRFPRYAKVRFSECDHEISWCWVCSITPDMRPNSVGIAMRQSDSSEFGEIF